MKMADDLHATRALALAITVMKFKCLGLEGVHQWDQATQSAIVIARDRHHFAAFAHLREQAR